MDLDSARPPDGYSETAAEAFCQAVASGKTITAACALPGMPTLNQLAHWRRTMPAFKARVIEAKELGAEAMANEVVDIADTEPDPQKARNRIDSRKWLAGVIKPKEYGPRVDLNVTTQVDHSAAHQLAQERLRLMRDPVHALIPQVIDGEVIHALRTTDTQSDAAPVSPSIFD